MKVLVQMSLDLDISAERVAYDLLSGTPQHAQKELMVSALLYYTKSPSYLVEVKMEDFLEKLEKLNRIFSDPSYNELVRKMDDIASIETKLIQEVSSAVTSKVEASLASFEFSGPKKKPRTTVSLDCPEDLMNDLLGQFGTEGS
jgi:hypothetical protein